VLGRTSLATPPTLAGRPIFGHTLTVSTSQATPAEAVATYQWYRGPTPITGATGPSYTLHSGDVGLYVGVRVTLSAPHWAPSTYRVAAPSRVLSVPRLVVRTSVSGDHVVVTFRVAAPGIDAPAGIVHVLDHGTQIARARITDGRGQLRLGPLTKGQHRFALVYDGPLMTELRQYLLVSIP